VCPLRARAPVRGASPQFNSGSVSFATPSRRRENTLQSKPLKNVPGGTRFLTCSVNPKPSPSSLRSAFELQRLT
jgi:hypothetical protein